MSATAMEDGHSKTLSSAEQDDEGNQNTGKPCIDFQPDDSWHIKEDSEDECNNSKRKRSARKRRHNSQYSVKDSSSVTVNGESMNNMVDKNDTEHDGVSVETSDKDSTGVKCNSVASDVDSESDNDSEPANKKQKSSLPCDSPSANGEVGSSSPKNSNGITDELNCIDTMENSTSDISEACQTTEPSSNNLESTEDKNERDVPESECERVETDENKDIIEECISDSPCNSKSHTDSKREDADIAIIEEKVSTVNSDGGESDNDVQIISTPKKSTPVVVAFPNEQILEQSLSKEPTMSKEELLLSPGFPYLNSLTEKVKGFKAGKYKPVKFPHMGTLMLEEHEVIIESPSLLVPLLIKEPDEFPVLDEESNDAATGEDPSASKPKVRRNFFQSSVGQFLINLGASRVLEYYHRDMKHSKQRQLRKDISNQKHKEAVEYHHEKLTRARGANSAFNFPTRKCEFCDFKTESRLVMDGHYLMPHITARREFRCNFCTFMCRDPKEIAFHFEAIHNKILVSEDQITLHECRFCSFHSEMKSKVNAHMNRCRKYFLPSQNQSPPFDFEFPGVTTKPVTIGDVIAHRRMLMGTPKVPYTNAGQAAVADSMTSAFARKKLASVLNLGAEAFPDSPTLIKHLMGPHSKQPPSGFQLPPGIVLTRPRVRAQQMRQGAQSLQPRIPGLRPTLPRGGVPYPSNMSPATHLASSGISITPITKQDSATARMSAAMQGGGKNITLTPISSTGNQVSQKPGPPQPVALFTNVAGSDASKARAGMTAVPQGNRMPLAPGGRPIRMMPPYQRLNTPPSQVVKNSSGNTFVLCEICDSYIKDLEELRSHMNWVHKVKIHPKMLVSRPPLNCQKCQWRFFTDQGLERHLLGAHGLVTTNMQEMANKNQDGGRCIICGAVFTYKLVSHMTQVHKVTLKPAHLSYKCTVCTATFTLYRLFESHVYNVHSASAKRPTEESPSEPPAKKEPPPTPTTTPAPTPTPVKTEQAKPEEPVSEKCNECGATVENMEKHIIQKHMKECRVKLCRIEKCEKCLYSSDEMLVIHMPMFEDDDDSDSDGDSSEDDDENSDVDDSSECSKGGKDKVLLEVEEEVSEKI